MSPEDWEKLAKAADAIWPRAILTRSSIILGLALLGAESVLPKTRRERKT